MGTRRLPAAAARKHRRRRHVEHITVGPTGVVYGQNSPFIIEKFAEKPWTARLAKPVNKNVVKVTREFEDPLPPEAKDLDAVVIVLFYHDTFWMKTDQAKMNAAAFRALKPGGVLAIWSAAQDEKFKKALGDAGFAVDEVAVRARENGKGAKHIIWFARKR